MGMRPGPTVAEVGEQGVIAAIRAVCPSDKNGDDAAVLDLPTVSSRPVLTTDTLVAGQHFTEAWSTYFHVGAKAVVQNFADIEAMGARPVGVLLALTLPGQTALADVTDLVRGMKTIVDEFHAELVGGDITQGPQVVIGVTAVGVLGGPVPPLQLHRARPAQQVIASGRIGYSAAGLAMLQHFGPRDGAVPAQLAPLVAAHRIPSLHMGRGVIARAARATSMTDNSDGLIRDLSVLAERSGIAIDLDPDAIAPDELLLRAGEVVGVDPWEWVLTGGEDHTLLGTTSYPVPSGFRVIGQTSRCSSASSLPPVTVGSMPPKYTTGWSAL